MGYLPLRMLIEFVSLGAKNNKMEESVHSVIEIEFTEHLRPNCDPAVKGAVTDRKSVV